MTAGERETIRYSSHIKPLFRPDDVDSMSWAFDLGSYEDVSANADHILERLSGGTMPCDGPWPPERIELFERWVKTGKNP